MRSSLFIAVPGAALLFTGCFDPLGLFGPSKLKVDEIEIRTSFPGQDDTVIRKLIDYDDKGRVVEIQQRQDDVRQSWELNYQGDTVDGIDYVGPGNDRVRVNFDVSGDKIVGGERSGDDFDADFEVDYFNDDEKFLKAIVFRKDLSEQFDASVLVETETTFSYQGNNLDQMTTDNITIVEGEPGGDTRGIVDYKYDEKGRVSRIDSEFDDGVEDTDLVFQSYDVDYTEDGRVDEVEDFDADDDDYFRVDYDEDGRVVEVEHVTGDVTTTFSYSYAEGDVRGGFLTPDVPCPADLKGKPQKTVGASTALFGMGFVGR
jgi:hypothetical protein